MTNRQDIALVERCLQGDLTSFERLIDKYQKVVFNAALRIVGDFDDAEDVTQAVFVKAYENLRCFDPTYKFFSWIYKMTVNESINLASRRKSTVSIGKSMVSPETLPDARLEAAQLESTVQDAIGELSPDHRVVIVLRHFADLSYHELSYVLDIPVKTVKSRLYAARRRLVDILQRRGIREHG